MFDDLKNNIDFCIRNKTKFSRKNFVETNLEILNRVKLENLYTTDVLNQFFSKSEKETIKVLDIGSKNWFYAQGEFKFFNDFCNDVSIDGVEIDAHRLYSNFYSRYEVAKFYMQNLTGLNYIIGNLFDIKNKYDYITWFLPFVILEPHIYWGLPRKYFCPEKMLEHAYSLLNDEGEMLIINQGEAEACAQCNLLEKLKVSYKSLGLVKSQFYQYKYDRFGFLVKK